MINLDEPREEREFRTKIRKWLTQSIPERIRGSKRFADRLEADRILASHGYLGFAWPREFGGMGASPALTTVLDDERARIGIPTPASPSRFGTHLLGPTLMRHGTVAQQREFLPPILKARHIWCQGFSEPDAGSDLAGVKCLAVDNGDHLLVSGSKIWTTQANEADWCFALVRSLLDAPRHRNLSFVLISMRQRGVEIQPLVQMTGEAEFSQVFFDEALVEPGHMIGRSGEGWQVAMTTLSSERSYGQLSRFREYQVQIQRITKMVQLAPPDRPTGAWLHELGYLAAQLAGIRSLSYKITSLAAAGEDIGALPSLAKLWWSTTHQRLTDLGFRVSAALGLDEDYWYPLWLASRAETLYAGTSQIQRNIIAERHLGLPR